MIVFMHVYNTKGGNRSNLKQNNQL